jgi:hypothetical protein
LILIALLGLNVTAVADDTKAMRRLFEADFIVTFDDIPIGVRAIRKLPGVIGIETLTDDDCQFWVVGVKKDAGITVKTLEALPGVATVDPHIIFQTQIPAAPPKARTPFHPKELLCKCPDHPDAFSPHPLVHHARACCLRCPICGENLTFDDKHWPFVPKHWGHFEVERLAFLVGCTSVDDAEAVREWLKRLPAVAGVGDFIPGIATRTYLLVHTYRGSNLTKANLAQLPGVEVVDENFKTLHDKSNRVNRGAYLLECSDVSRARRALGWVIEVWNVRPHEKDPNLLWVDTIRSVESEVTPVSLMTIPGVVKATPGKARL